MIDHCDSSFLHRRFDGEAMIPLSHQLPAPGASMPTARDPRAGSGEDPRFETRRTIALRDKAWTECKLFQVPSATSIAALRLQNDAVVKLLAAHPRAFSSRLAHVELLLCKVCEMFCARCELELEAETRRSGNLSLEFVRRSFEMALDDEELPPGHL